MEYFFISHKIGPNDIHRFPAPHFKLSRYFWSAVRSVQFSAPHKAVHQMLHFTSSSLYLGLICWCKEPFSCRTPLLPWQCGFNLTCSSCIIYHHAKPTYSVFHIVQLFLSMTICSAAGCMRTLITTVRHIFSII